MELINYQEVWMLLSKVNLNIFYCAYIALLDFKSEYVCLVLIIYELYSAWAKEEVNSRYKRCFQQSEATGFLIFWDNSVSITAWVIYIRDITSED